MAGRSFGILTDSKPLLSRCQAICKEFSYDIEAWEDIEAFNAAKPQPDLIVAFLSIGPKGRPLPPAELAKVIRLTAPTAFLVCVSPNFLVNQDAVFAKNSGVDLVLLEDEVFSTGKLEFIATQILKWKYLPVKRIDLVPSLPIPFDLYHLFPQRKKFLKIVSAGETVDDDKFQQAVGVGEFYFERDQAPEFNQYMVKATDSSRSGIIKRSRSQFLALYSGFSKLVFQLTNQSQWASFSEGQELLVQCTKLCSDLLLTLATSDQVWELINNSAIGNLGSVERGPAVAAYAGVFGLYMGVDLLDELMLSSLLADIGLVFLHPDILAKIRDLRTGEFTRSELESYENYPNKTLEVCLSRKLPIPIDRRHILLASQERADGKGFPKKLTGDKLSIESQLIAFAREFDRRTMVQMGKERLKPEEVLHTMLLRETLAGQFTDYFLLKLKKAIAL